MGAGAEVGSNILLFSLVFGMSATVDVQAMRKQLTNRNALLTGLFLQFVVLPFLGFAVVKALNMSSPMGITLLVITSSPGGSYSNWWCSMFNADLALSVTMTAISTLTSTLMLPVNLVIYTASSYSGSVVHNLDWQSLFVSLIIVISAISIGLFCSAKIHSHKFNLLANKIGNVAGIALVLFSVLVSSRSNNSNLWGRGWSFYLGVATPCIVGLVVGNIMTSSFQLRKPERVTVSVECCYQNVGIATSVAITMFDGVDLAEAIAVPLYYGLVEACVLGVYCTSAWKMGWTKAPRDESFCVMIATSYEVELAETQDIDAIEIVLGTSMDGLPLDLIFHFAEEDGYTVDHGSLMMYGRSDLPNHLEPGLGTIVSAPVLEENSREETLRKVPLAQSLTKPDMLTQQILVEKTVHLDEPVLEPFPSNGVGCIAEEMLEKTDMTSASSNYERTFVQEQNPPAFRRKALHLDNDMPPPQPESSINDTRFSKRGSRKYQIVDKSSSMEFMTQVVVGGDHSDNTMIDDKSCSTNNSEEENVSFRSRLPSVRRVRKGYHQTTGHDSDTEEEEEMETITSTSLGGVMMMNSESALSRYNLLVNESLRSSKKVSPPEPI